MTRFWIAGGEIDELFEEDKEDEEDGPEALGEEEKEEEEEEDGPTTAGATVAALKAELLALLPSTRGECYLHDPEDAEADDEVMAVCTKLGAFPPTYQEARDRLLGDWELAYSTSPSFSFNGGFTGVGRTTPGGGEFLGLRQSIAATGLSDYVETLELGLGKSNLDVDVRCDWGLQTRTDVVTLEDRLHFECTPVSVKYGVITVDGKRVSNGWKTMRVLNGLALAYLDADLRVQRGNTRNTWFVWRRI